MCPAAHLNGPHPALALAPKFSSHLHFDQPFPSNVLPFTAMPYLTLSRFISLSYERPEPLNCTIKISFASPAKPLKQP